MKIYWRDRQSQGPAQITRDMQARNAVPWEKCRSEIFLGNGGIFINPSEYSIDGFFLTEQDLEDLLAALQK